MRDDEDVTRFTSIAVINDFLKSLQNKSLPESGTFHILSISEYHICRPDDVELLLPEVRLTFYKKVRKELGARSILSWRTPIEEDVADAQVIKRYDESAPMKDFIHDKNCFADTNFKAIKIYGRCVATDA